MADPFAASSVASREPLALLLTQAAAPAAAGKVGAQRFEFSSRGDRVCGRLLVPDPRSGPCPLVVVLGVAGTDCASLAADAGPPLLARGIAVATVDLPLHGERASAKFSERLFGALSGAAGPNEPDANGRALLLEFTRQGIADLARCCDALSGLPAIDAQRIGLLGTGSGAMLGVQFASRDPRIGVLALANLPKPTIAELDTEPEMERIAPRKVFYVEPDALDSESTRFFSEHL